ncbi:hypothetical protein [Isoptericola sp. b408]|uniref:hypothetical protein n=1 Tax=Isoptericola sp. b408 TaxID=3064653 RepID=UPI0027141440|nr:hypothetical protein [Isoptericola sp. b408]MDO8151712.1 hypothetical protein [Isoptericola sp. b408]
MEDVFKATVEARLPKQYSTWAAFDVVQRKIIGALDDVPGDVRPGMLNVVDSSGSELHRGSLQEAREAAEEHEFYPERLSQVIEVVDTSEGILPIPQARAQVFYFEIYNGDRHLQVTVSASKRVLCAGLERAAQTAFEKIELEAGVEEKQHQIGEGVEEPQASGHVLSEAASREVESKWLARTWRDHTATFVLTVLGGVAVLVLAAWLGLGT